MKKRYTLFIGVFVCAVLLTAQLKAFAQELSIKGKVVSMEKNNNSYSVNL